MGVLRHICDRHLDLLVVDVMCVDRQRRLVSHEPLEDWESRLTWRWTGLEVERAGVRQAEMGQEGVYRAHS